MATRRTARVLTIRGDNGVGKTRLLYEVERRLRKGGYDVGFHTATCPPRGNEFPLSGIICMLQVLCGTADGDSEDRVLAVQPRLRALGLHEDEVNAVLGALGVRIQVSSANPDARLRQAFARMLHSLCEDRPHTFAWDVAHAMDEESLALLGDVARRLKQSRLVIALAGRAGFSHPLETFEGHVAIDLGDLAPAEAEHLVALRLGVESVPEDLPRALPDPARRAARPSPLFVEEVIKVCSRTPAHRHGRRAVARCRRGSSGRTSPSRRRCAGSSLRAWRACRPRSGRRCRRRRSSATRST